MEDCTRWWGGWFAESGGFVQKSVFFVKHVLREGGDLCYFTNDRLKSLEI